MEWFFCLIVFYVVFDIVNLLVYGRHLDGGKGRKLQFVPVQSKRGVILMILLNVAFLVFAGWLCFWF